MRGVSRDRLLPSIGARAVAVRRASGADFWHSTTRGTGLEPGVKRILLDHRVQTTLDQSVPQIGAPAAWQRGLTGRGVKVAVLDTGIDASHPDLTGRIAEAANFTDSPDTGDRIGHGTHVASILAGTGAASDGRYRGVAPDATLFNGKVLSDRGSGTESWIIVGMEWAAARADVVNLSLGSRPTDGTDPVSRALNTLSQQTGALFVVAAGNCLPFPERHQVHAPASADHALAVANLHRDGTLNEESCLGPRAGDSAVKPEIAAPGTEIVAARAAGTDPGQPVGEHYASLTGTSMATPHVAGTAALLAQAQPNLTGAQLRARLISTADPAPDTEVDTGGVGRVDADQATDGSVSADTAEIALGFLKWPHPSDPTVTRELVYRNSGTSPVTLNLTGALDPGDQGPAPRFSAAQVVVPAQGQASVQVSFDLAATGFGPRAGRLFATPAGGGDPLVISFGWNREPERYDLTITGVDRDGAPAEATVVLGRPDTGESFSVEMTAGVAKLRLPPAVYDVSSAFFQPATDQAPERVSLMATPQVRVPGQSTLLFDARRALPVENRVEGQPGLRAEQAAMTYRRLPNTGTDGWSSGALDGRGPRQFFAAPTEAATTGRLEFSTAARLHLPPYAARVLGSDPAELAVQELIRGPRFTGQLDLLAVNAGTGSPEDLAGDKVRGKLAVISCGTDESSADKVLAAAEAGAKAVLLYNPDEPGLGTVETYWGPDDQIPALEASRSTARELLARVASGPTTVRITGVAVSPRVYDIVVPTAGRVPANPSHLAQPQQFARVDETFGAHLDGVPTQEARLARTPLGVEHLGSLLRPFGAPLQRTSYVLSGPVDWSQIVVTDTFFWSQTLFRRYRAGERTAIRWTTPVAASGLPDSANSFLGVRREDSALLVALSAFTSGPSQYDETNNPGTYRLVIERDGKVVSESTDPTAFADVDPAPADYRIVFDAERNQPWWKLSTKVHTEWTFRSSTAAEERLPLILADTTVPTADLHSTVPTNRSTPIVIALRHQAGSTRSPIASTKLEMSYDDKTWTALPLTATGNDRYVAFPFHPTDKSGQTVSLRLTTTNTSGATLHQHTTAAYALR